MNTTKYIVIFIFIIVVGYIIFSLMLFSEEDKIDLIITECLASANLKNANDISKYIDDSYNFEDKNKEALISYISDVLNSTKTINANLNDEVIEINGNEANVKVRVYVKTDRGKNAIYKNVNVPISIRLKFVKKNESWFINEVEYLGINKKI